MYQRTCKRMFIAALFITEQPNAHQQKNGYIVMVEYYIAMRMNYSYMQ